MRDPGNVADAFVREGVHHLAWRDDFCAFSREVRDELLAYPDWTEMGQTVSDGIVDQDLIVPARQNGVTTGHLDESHRAALPECLRFRDWLGERLEELAAVAGVEEPGELGLEMNAMSYGEGCWLAPHTDFVGRRTVRLVAWILYLTDPADGEWDDAMGGALRVWNDAGEERRLRPRFDRFAMFRVSPGSHHEIEPVTWASGWGGARLALSGWIRGPSPEKPEAEMPVYRAGDDWRERRAEVEATALGARAMSRLLAQQREHCGLDAERFQRRARRYERDLELARSAPEGTWYERRAPGPPGAILVVDEEGRSIYLGAPEGYRSRAGS